VGLAVKKQVNHRLNGNLESPPRMAKAICQTNALQVLMRLL
jgi:hypothetical protein